jgi:hypothetical protein
MDPAPRAPALPAGRSKSLLGGPEADRRTATAPPSPRGRSRPVRQATGSSASRRLRTRERQGLSATRGPRPCNVANPMVGCGVQQTREVPSGVNRRSREERQGRNEFGAWQLRAEGRGRALDPSPPRGWRCAGRSSERGFGWEWTLGTHVDGGAIIDNPMRGVPIPSRSRTSEPRGLRVSTSGLPRPAGRRTAHAGIVSEGEAKVTRAGPLVTRPQGAFR